MNKILLLSLCMLIGSATRIFAMDDGASTSDGRYPATQEMIVVQVEPTAVDQDTQTEHASLIQEFELIGARESHGERHHSIGTQMGQPVRIFRGLHEESIDDVTAKAVADDQMKKAIAMRKRMKYMAPCYCISLGVSIYFMYNYVTTILLP